MEDARAPRALIARFFFGTNVQAFATSFGDLTGIYFTGGILRMLPEDDRLAIVVGHEFAHLVRGHTGHLRTSKRYEAEADLLGLYFAARAGHEVSGAAEVWNRFTVRSPYASIDFNAFYSHPMGAERAAAIDATVAEIARQRGAGLPLVPDEERFSLGLPELDDAVVEAHLVRQREAALARFQEDQQRVVDVAYRLAVAGAPFCEEQTAPAFGALVARLKDFLPDKMDQAAEAFGTGRGMRLLAIAPGSPVDVAGLEVGDEVLRVAGARARKPSRVFDRIRRSELPLVLRIRRDDDEWDATLPAVEACAFGVHVPAFAWKTHTEGHRNRKDMVVPTGLLRVVEDDDELAIAIAHQMGHQIVGKFRSVEHEPEADEIGLGIAARAGFDVSKAPAFWDRWAAVQFWTISSDMDGEWIDHGAMARRAPVIERVAAELAGSGASAAR